MLLALEKEPCCDLLVSRFPELTAHLAFHNGVPDQGHFFHLESNDMCHSRGGLKLFQKKGRENQSEVDFFKNATLIVSGLNGKEARQISCGKKFNFGLRESNWKMEPATQSFRIPPAPANLKQWIIQNEWILTPLVLTWSRRSS